MEEALRESQERLQIVLDTAKLGTWQLNLNDWSMVSSATCKANFGFAAEEELSYAQVGRMIDSVDRPKWEAAIEQAISTQGVFEAEYRVHWRNGEVHWILAQGRAFQASGGRHLLGVTQDVTERKRSQDRLKENEERYRLLVEGAPDYAMFIIDVSNHIVYWSKGAEKVFGWTTEEALGKSGEMIFTPEDRAKEQEEKEMAIARKKGTAPDRRWHMRKDGTRVWIDGVMHRLDFEDGSLRGFAKIARDATEEWRASEALQKAHAELETRVYERTAELQSMNDTLEDEIERRQVLEREILQVTERERARISQDLHDSLCQDLTATALLLKSRAKSLRERSPEVAKTLEEAAQTVNSNARQARELARGIHPFELGKDGLILAVRELCARVKERVNCHVEMPRAIRLDESVAVNLYRIAQEAVVNALKHAKAKNLTVKLTRVKDEIVLSVSDDGKKAPAEVRPGMGLHIMHYRASTIGGRIEIQSKPRKGTKIICRVSARRR
jgi:PAS domain S-box-containing protein